MMKDKDIIKALECCNKQNCADCPLYNGNSFSEKCKAICLKEVASLINRQQAEIERLEIELDAMRGAANSYKLHYNEAKSEAIKEFAERLKKELSFGKYIQAEQIDNLVKEMVGENNA